MNKGSILCFVGESEKGFTKHKPYVAIAGYGDGVPRNDGKLGAFIKDENSFVVEDDNNNCRVVSMNSGKWKLRVETPQAYFPCNIANPIPATRAVC